MKAAAADRDIVYSARYYNPPKNKSVSRFHLYRINPDGSRRIQLTRGDDDDRDPKWSPDGRYILFLRTSTNGNACCAYDVKLGQIRTVYRFPRYDQDQSEDTTVDWAGDSRSILVQRYRIHTHGDPGRFTLWKIDVKTGSRHNIPVVGDTVMSPLGDRSYVQPEKGAGYVAFTSGRKFPTQATLSDAKWLNQDRVSGTVMREDDTDLYIVNSKGQTIWKKTFRELRTQPGVTDDMPNWRVVEEPRGLPNYLICKQNVGHAPEGANRVWGWNLVDVKQGKMQTLLEGMSVAMERGGKRYTAVPIVEPVPYDGKRTVFTSPLQVISLPERKIRTLVSGLVWVNSADWR